MTRQSSDEQETPGNGNGNGAGVGRTVLDDLRRGDLRQHLHRDLRELYDFYLDEERRSHLRRMSRGRRWWALTGWLLKCLILKLPPARRFLLLVALLALIYGVFHSFGEHRSAGVLMLFVSSLALLVVLMLELKDKLLARDELAVGRRVQLALLPDRDPELAGWQISLLTRPANEVGGDLVDYLYTGDDRVGIALGDVSGKGLGAALLMAKLQATLRSLATDYASLAELGTRTNGILCRDGVQGRFATLVYIEARSDSGELRVLNAGHLPPVVIKASASERMKPVAPPLGVARDVTYAEQRVELTPGDMLLVYSDGLTEACNASGEFFGEERLWRMVPGLRELDAVQVGGLLLAEVGRFVGDEHPSDDLSLAVLKRLG